VADLPTQQGSNDDSGKPPSTADDELLRKIREDFRYCKSYWRENYEESEKDMRCMAAIPPTEFVDDRKNRPVIWPDETSQYVKQANNNLRQNKRSIKISPRSEGATDKDAEHRQAYIRGIEYASQAQSIYTTAFEACVASAMGFARLTTCVTGPKGEQEPRFKRIPNQFTCFPDPDALESDFSDSAIYFVLDSMRTKTFKRRYPKAKKLSFTDGDREMASDWFSGDNITVAEYWTREEEETEDGEKEYTVTQYITNGLEILETNDWIGSWIPIIGMFGEELYIRTGGESKRMFMSLIRRARPAQQMMAYIASQEAEEFQLAPRAPLIVYKGMLDPETDKDIHRVPRAFLEASIPLNWNPQWGAPPMPSRPQFTPNAQAYEVAYERWRRSHQAAMGIAPLPTPAQSQSQKSGVALERIQTQEAIGAFHFTDNFSRFLANFGRQTNELITVLAELDSLPAELMGKDQKEEDIKILVAPRKSDAYSEQLDEAKYMFAHRGQFEVTVSEGPFHESEREEASEFADLLLQTAPQMGLPPPIIQQLLSIAVKLKNIGTYGDEIADLLAPPDPNSLTPQAKAILSHAQGQIQQLQAELQQLKLEKFAKLTELQGKKDMKVMDHMVEMSEADKDRETKIAVAEITTQAQNMSERMAAIEDLVKQFHSQAHEVASNAVDQAHEKFMAQFNAQQAQQTQQSDQGHELGMSAVNAAQQQAAQPSGENQ
jgi:hypothetical protein